MPHKARKARKTPEARAREAEMIRMQLDDLGLPREEVAEAHRALDSFSIDGIGSTQSWRVPGFGVTVTLLLSTQPHIVSFAKVSKS